MSRTVQEVKEGLALEIQRKQALIDQANATTGKEDTTLTGAVGSLIEKCSSGGSDEALIKQAELVYMCTKIELASNKDITELELDCINKTSFQYFIEYCTNLERVKLTNTGKVNNWYFAFRGCEKMTSLETLDFSSADSAVNNAFRNLPALIHFRAVPNTLKHSISFPDSKYLDDLSIQSIIDCLIDLTGQTAQTLTVHKDVEARMSDEQKATITAKNWTLVSK